MFLLRREATSKRRPRCPKCCVAKFASLVKEKTGSFLEGGVLIFEIHPDTVIIEYEIYWYTPFKFKT